MTPATVPERRCGRCGYRVDGLPTDVCPECGSDLNVVGVATPGQRMHRWRWGAARIGIWTAALLVVAGLFWVTADQLPLPRVTVRQRFVTCFPGDGGQGLFTTVIVSQTVHEFGPANDRRPRPLGAVTLCLSNSSNATSPSDLHVDWPTKAYHYTAGGHTVRHDGGFGPAVVLAWLADNNVRPSDGVRPPTVPTATIATYQADHLIGDVGQMALPAGPWPRGSPFFPTSPSQVFTESHTLPGVDRAVTIGAVCAWLMGSAVLWRRPPARRA